MTHKQNKSKIFMFVIGLTMCLALKLSIYVRVGSS